MEKERHIYIEDILFCIFRKWRMILIWMVAFAVIADGFFAVKSYKTMTVIQQEQQNDEDVLASYKSQLSEDDIKKVEDAYKLYSTYKKALDKSMDYYNHSIKMQIDPNNVATISLQYGINNSKILKDAINAYSNAVLSEDSCEYINEKAELNSSVGYISELISFYSNDDSKLKIVEDIDSKSMLISIIAPNKETCEIIADVVEEKIQEQTPKIQQNLGDFEIKKIDRNYVNKANGDLLNEQQGCVFNLNSIKTSISNLNATLTDDQKIYYSALINQSDGTLTIKDTENIVNFQPISLKYICVGLFMGAILASLWYMMIYMTSGRLRIAEEVEEYYQVPIMGLIQSEKTSRLKKNIIDSFIGTIFGKDRSQSEDDTIQLIGASILIAAKKNNMQSIHITGVADSMDVEKVKKQILEKIQNIKLDLKCSSGKSIFKDVESLSNLSDSEGVVFIEEVGKSNFSEIGKEINVCLTNNITIIGTVVIE